MRGHAVGSFGPFSFFSASPSSWSRHRRLHWPCHEHGPIFPSRLVLCRHGEDGSFPSTVHKCTYQGSSNWLQQELPHLLSMQKKVVSGLLLTRGNWTWTVEKSFHYQLCGTMKFCNVTGRNEIFVNEVAANAVLLSAGTVDQFTTSVQIYPEHPEGNPPSRKDGYWPAYILKAGQSTHLKVVIDIKSHHHHHPLKELQALRFDLEFVSYGPGGRFLERQHVVLPLQYPDEHQNATWRTVRDGAVLPVKTHILCHMDDPLDVLHVYAMHHAKFGDTIVIGETPLAIMQGRFRHPCNVRPSIMAKLACKLFHPTSSLATACGMQTLLDMVGKLRAVLAIVVAVLGRLVGVRGLFYRLAGEQARLIDDVTGTLPPYDQFITLGPVHAQATVDFLQEKTGIGVAIVDANDLGRVDVLAASDKVDRNLLNMVLKTNPAGNADEQTPIVIVRPLKNS